MLAFSSCSYTLLALPYHASSCLLLHPPIKYILPKDTSASTALTRAQWWALFFLRQRGSVWCLAVV